MNDRHLKLKDAIEVVRETVADEYIESTLELRLLDKSLTADVVEVVRCKDCKWYHGIGCAIEIVDESDEPANNDYCSFGERAKE